MGFTIYFGKLIENEVYNDNFENSISLSYNQADSFFNSTEIHKKIWNYLRKGDINGGDPVIVKLTTEIINLILNLTNTSCLNIQLKKALIKGQEQDDVLYSETR